MIKGVILAAGRGTRLAPLTKTITKVMLPVYDKPMIYYSIDIMTKAKIKDIMIVVSNSNKDMIMSQLGDGSELGVNIQYSVQEVADGTAGAFKMAREFIKDNDCLLIFGDNVFLGRNIESVVEEGIKNLKDGYSSIVAYKVQDPKRFGVAELSETGEILSLEEKPEHPKSDYAALGLYFYDAAVVDKMDIVKKSVRGEYEITDINISYMNEAKLKGIKIDNDDIVWFDAGTKDSLLDASIMAKKLYQEK